MSDKTTAVEKAKSESALVEYVPFGSQDKIKMNISIVQNLIAVRTKKGKTCSDRDAIKFMAMCQAKHLNPFEGDAFLIGYDGANDTASFSLVTAHQTYLKRAELHPEFDGMKSGLIIEDVNGDLKDTEGDFFRKGDKVVGGWATVFFKTRKQPMHKRLRLERFQKPYGIWQEDAAGMICKCAEADALRSSFPTMLGGLYLREELEVNTAPELAKPVFQPAKGDVKPLLFDVKPDPEPERVVEEFKGSPDPEQTTLPTDEKKTVPYNPLKALKNLCKMSGITEAQALDYLSASGAVDGSSSTLEEQFVATPEVIDHVAKHWQDISEKIKEQLEREEKK